MFVVQYARSIELILDYKLKAYLCHYQFCDDHSPWICSDKRVTELIQKCTPGKFLFLATNLRVSSMDAKETIRNRFAYVNLVLHYTRSENVHDFIKSILLIRQLKDVTNLSQDYLTKLEVLYWKLAPVSVKAWFKSTIKKILFPKTAIFYAPDYVWKSKDCKTTLEILREKWDKKVLMGLA